MTGIIFQPEFEMLGENELGKKICIKMENVPFRDYPMITTDYGAMADILIIPENVNHENGILPVESDATIKYIE